MNHLRKVPSHKITARPMRWEEEAQLSYLAGYQVFRCICLAIICAFKAFIVATVVCSLGYGLGPQFRIAAVSLVAFIAVAAWVRGVVLCIPRRMFFRQLARMDQQSKMVQVIEIFNPRAVELKFENWCAALAIEIGDNKILLIQEWFSIPGAQKTEDGEVVQSIETILETLEAEELGMEPSTPFPATNITLTRFANVGAITEVRTKGEFFHPESAKKPAVQTEAVQRYFGDSEIFKGSLAELECVLNRESQLRLHAYRKMVGVWRYVG